MLIVLFVVLLCVPLLELFLIFQVSALFGFFKTAILVVLISGVALVGTWMMRYAGLGVVRKIKSRLARGEMPAVELLDGVLILFAGVFMVTPGFLTDSLGLMLLVKPSRVLVRFMLVRYISRKIREAGWVVATASGSDGRVDGPGDLGLGLEQLRWSKGGSDGRVFGNGAAHEARKGRAS